MTFGRPPVSEEVRFNALIDKTGECWLWLGSTCRGYGQFRRGAAGGFKMVKAHRFAYELWVGPVPDELLVCHECDNPLCMRPKHLFVGTQLDNQTDMWNKGRQSINTTGVRLYEDA